MKTICHSLLGALLLLGVTATWASEPAPSKGKVLLLENERVLEGDIERVGDRYRVQRKIGETWVPAEKALRLCANLEDAYTYLCERANRNDPDERLRLASWCRQNGLREQALHEVKAAVALRPEHALSRRLLESMQKTAAIKSVEPPLRREEPEPMPLPPIELTAPALSLFSTKVQPILMNTCASCHATGRGGSFKLTRTYDLGDLARKTTQQNLAAVLAYLDPEQPLTSKFLLKAVSGHGSDVSKAPLPGRDSPPYRVLEEWVRLTVANNPHLLERHAVQTTAFATPETRTSPAPGSKTEPLRKVETSADARPMPLPNKTFLDPVDPDEFNRQHHATAPAGASKP